MADDTIADILLTGFTDADLRPTLDALAALGRRATSGDAVNDSDAAFVLAAAYDDRGLRGMRAAALEDTRPWCFCVSVGNRTLIAAAALAREGALLLLPPENRELKRVLSTLAEEAKERGSGDAAFLGLSRLEADFSWPTAAFEVSRVSRRISRLLTEADFYDSRAGEDDCALSLEEALVNSVEHGNLELDSSLRPGDSLQEDNYETEREKRLADPVYGDRLIRLRLEIAEEEAILTIEDEGKGFDVSKLDETPSGLDVSGKGFWLIKQPFDVAEYNEKGNKLTLTRRRHSTRPNGAPRAR
jgi:anti-sigma regulatory factor (Ser/Thr protein kinase)